MFKTIAIAKSRIRHMISQYGGTSHTNTLDRLAEGVVDDIIGSARLGPLEEPLLASFLEPGRWCLLTTRRLVWSRDGAVAGLSWEKVAIATMSRNDGELILRGMKGKEQIEELLVTDTAGNDHPVYVEPGYSSYDLIWSIAMQLRGGIPQIN